MSKGIMLVFVNGSTLEDVQNRISTEILPVTVVVGTFGVIGVVGNIFSIVFFVKNKRSSTMTFMLHLASVNLVVCLLAVSKVIELSKLITFHNPTACRISRFLTHWTVTSSSMFLGIIAMDRFKKVCQPFKRQLQAISAKYIAAAIYVASCGFAIKNYIMTGCAEVRLELSKFNTTIIGHFCTTVQRFEKTNALFLILDSIFVITVWSIMVTCYTKMILKLAHLHKKRKQKQIQSLSFLEVQSNLSLKISENTEASSVNDPYKLDEKRRQYVSEKQMIHRKNMRDNRTLLLNRSLSEQNIFHFYPELQRQSRIYTPLHRASSESQILDTEEGLKDKRQPNLLKKYAKQYSKKPFATLTRIKKTISKHRDSHLARAAVNARENRVTYMLFTVSILYILFFLPSSMTRLTLEFKFKSEPEFALRASVQFALSLVYMNSVFNPFVYVIFNREFRKFVKCNRSFSKHVPSLYPKRTN